MARLKRLTPGQSHAMQDVAYHYTNLWFVGQKANWPLATFYLDDKLEARMKDVPKDVQLVFTWNGGGRSSRAAELFEKNGYKTATFCALNDWKAKGCKTEAAKKAPAGAVKPE